MTFHNRMSASALALSTALLAAGGALASPEITEIELSQAGIAHFTLQQEVTGPALTFTVPEAAASDILASLVVRDPSGGVVELQTATPRTVDAALLGSKFQAGLPGNLQSLLGALVGETVSLTNRSGASTGMVVGVKGAAPDTDRYPTVLIFNGTEVQEIELQPGLKVALSPETTQRMASALDAAGSSDALRQFDLTLSGTDTRDVSLSYVTEAPAWKNAYRLLLDENRLQGWATLENTSGADWQSVDLTLTTGFPIAYQSDLIDPKRIARPDVSDLWETPGMPVGVRHSSGGAGLMAMTSTSHSGSGQLLSMFSGSDQTFEAVNANGILRYTMPSPITLETVRTTSLMYFDAPIEPDLHALYRPQQSAEATFLAVGVLSQVGLAPGLISVQDAQGFVGDAPFPGALADDSFLLPVATAVGAEVITSNTGAVRIETATYSGDTLSFAAKQIVRTVYEATVPPEVSRFTVEHPKMTDTLGGSNGTVRERPHHYEISVPAADGIATLEVTETKTLNEQIKVSASSFAKMLDAIASDEAEAPAALVETLTAAHQLLVTRSKAEAGLKAQAKRYEALLEEQKRRRATLEAEDNTELLARYRAAMGQIEQQILEVFDEIEALEAAKERLDQSIAAELEKI
jgi:hypothetical protein